MKYRKPVKTVLIRDPIAVDIINKRALRENRSAGNTASVVIVESLNQKNNNKESINRQG